MADLKFNSPDYILINGKSSHDVGLWIDTPPVPPMAKQRYTQYQTGADTDSVLPDDSFENIIIKVTAYQFFTPDFDNRKIYNFLKDAKTLQTSRFHDFYYNVLKVYVNSPESSSNGSRIKYQIEFECEPFKYSTSNIMQEIENQATVINSGNRYSRPLWVVTPIEEIQSEGICDLTVNGETFRIYNGLDTPCCIDCQRMVVYTNTEIITQRATGKFPFLASGENIISWNSNIESVSLQKFERWY